MYCLQSSISLQHSEPTRGNMMRKYCFQLLFGWFPALCQSEIPCNTRQTPSGTLYLLSNISTSDCIYSWNNGSKVLSTNKENMDGVVLNSSFNSLLTIPCYEEVNYLRLCKSEKDHTTATCKTSCPVSSPRNGGEESDGSENHPALSGSETSPNHIVVPVTAFFLLIVAVVFLVYRKLRVDESEVLPSENVMLDI